MPEPPTERTATVGAMVAIEVPKLNNNDEGCVLRDWIAVAGARVEEDEIIAVLETSKSTFDLVAESSGVLHRTVEEGAECLFGSAIGYLFPDEEARSRYLDEAAARPAALPEEAALTITRGARELMEASGVDEARVRELGKRVIKRSDVEVLLGIAEAPAPVSGAGAAAHVAAGPEEAAPHAAVPAETAEGRSLSRRQQAIGRTVGRSHREIPASFVTVKVYCDAVEAGLDELRERTGQPVGLPECVIKAIGTLAERFELLYGGLDGGGLFVPAPEPAVGVTVDVGTGLFIPVLREVAARPLEAIADDLLELRIKAMRDRFRDEDLAGGAITLSVNNDADVLFAVPIILPGQVAMVSLGSTQEEPALSAAGELVRRRWTMLGLAYDHRVINGREAVDYLSALKGALEAPAELLGGAAEAEGQA